LILILYRVYLKGTRRSITIGIKRCGTLWRHSNDIY